MKISFTILEVINLILNKLWCCCYLTPLFHHSHRHRHRHQDYYPNLDRCHYRPICFQFFYRILFESALTDLYSTFSFPRPAISWALNGPLWSIWFFLAIFSILKNLWVRVGQQVLRHRCTRIYHQWSQSLSTCLWFRQRVWTPLRFPWRWSLGCPIWYFFPPRSLLQDFLKLRELCRRWF